MSVLFSCRIKEICKFVLVGLKKPVAGSSGNTCSEEYRGSSAFSEPESRAVRNFIQGRRGQIRSDMRQEEDDDLSVMFSRLYLTFHSYGQMFLYPWGYDSKAVAR